MQWSPEKNAELLMNSVQRALASFAKEHDDLITDSIINMASERANNHKDKIISIIPEIPTEAEYVVSGIMFIGLYSGFISGYLRSSSPQYFPSPPLEGDPEEADTRFDSISELFTHAYQCKEEAALFATHSSSIIFTNLKKLPSPLIENFTDVGVRFLEQILKVSLVSGFMDGFDYGMQQEVKGKLGFFDSLGVRPE